MIPKIRTSPWDEVFFSKLSFLSSQTFPISFRKFIFLNLALLTPSQTVDHPDLRSVDLLPELV